MIIITNNQNTEDSLPLFAFCGKPGIRKFLETINRPLKNTSTRISDG
jgi:hypothetical protein